MDLIKIGKYIAAKRKVLGLTQKQLAEKLNMSDKSVSKWERGICLPDVTVYLELCKILGISINEFRAGEDIPKETIEQTYIGSFIIDTMPHYFSSIADFKDLNQLTHLDVSLSDEKQVSMVTNFIEEASQNKWLDDETIKDFIYNYYSEIDLQTVDQEDYQRISSLCQNYDIDINLLTKGH